jgi:hypothetical protein
MNQSRWDLWSSAWAGRQGRGRAALAIIQVDVNAVWTATRRPTLVQATGRLGVQSAHSLDPRQAMQDFCYHTTQVDDSIICAGLLDRSDDADKM